MITPSIWLVVVWSEVPLQPSANNKNYHILKNAAEFPLPYKLDNIVDYFFHTHRYVPVCIALIKRQDALSEPEGTDSSQQAGS